jgi:VanZ family protein
MMRRLAYWLPAICIAMMISGFSTSVFSGEHTSRIIIPLLHWLCPFASQNTLELLHSVIRKAAHIAEFGLFSAAVFHGIRGECRGWQLEWAVMAFLIGAGYAGLDEWHQSFVPMREARIGDVLIDSTGALLAQLSIWAYLQLHRRDEPSPGPVEKST